MPKEKIQREEVVLDDSGWEDAIASLNASTTAIQNQGKTLRIQQKHLDSIRRTRRIERDHQSRANQLEAQNLTLAVGPTLIVPHPLSCAHTRHR
jgi:hypothetical protein